MKCGQFGITEFALIALRRIDGVTNLSNTAH